MPDAEQNRIARRDWDRLVARKVFKSTNRPQLVTTIASSLSEELLEILQPHFEPMVSAAPETLSTPEHFDKQAVFAAFRDDSTRLVEAALLLKLDLTISDCEHTFIWPRNGEALDTSRMQPLNRPSNDWPYQVAYTLFPSIQTEGRLGLRYVRHAEVVSVPVPTQSPPSERQAGTSA